METNISSVVPGYVVLSNTISCPARRCSAMDSAVFVKYRRSLPERAQGSWHANEDRIHFVEA
jgi:hypothetical protein